MATAFCHKAIELAKRAIEEDTAGNSGQAVKLYLLAIEYFLAAMKYEKNEKRKVLLKKKVTEYLERTERLKAGIVDEPTSSSTTPPTPPAPVGGSDEDDKLKAGIRATILSERPNVKWDDIAGLHQAKEALKEAVILPARFPSIFRDNREPWKGILLYGPPGTGKSYLAKAVATEAQGAFFSVSSADLVSKWQGESEKLVKSLFELAREQRPSVIFIDEIDSLCGARGDGQEMESSRRIKTQFLTQMEGVSNDMQGVLVLAATNTPWSLDMAIRRRFEKRIYIPLPSKGARSTMFRIHLGARGGEFTVDDFHALADATEHYSGSDIKAVVREALMMPVRIALSATHFKRSVDYWTPCSPGDEDGQEMTMMDIRDEDLHLPDLALSHLRQSVTNTRPTVSEGDLERYVDWTQQFGQDG